MSKPLRLLQVHSGNLYGGVETLLVTLARYRHLCPELETHFALCFPGQLNEELLAAGAPVYQLGNVRLRQPLSIWQARRALRALLQRGSFDLVMIHSCWVQAIFGLVVNAAALPLIFWLQNIASGRHWLERWARKTQPDFVLCPSRYIAASLKQLYPQAPSAVFYFPVAAPEVHEGRLNRQRMRAEWNTPADATVIIQVSRMEAWKGQVLHLQALSRLRQQPNWICWQVGGAQRPQEQSYAAELRALAGELKIADRVRFLGQQANVPQLLAAADIHCQPNDEPFGIAFIEALYAGLPLVTIGVGGALEIVTDECGLLAQPGDPVSLAAALQRLIDDPGLRTRLGAAAPARARQLCDVERQLLHLKDLCSSVIQDRAA